jgi:hypothetical protein
MAMALSVRRQSRRFLAGNQLTDEERLEVRRGFCGERADAFEHLDDGSLIATGSYLDGAGRQRYFLAVFVGKSCKAVHSCSGYYRDLSYRTKRIEEFKEARAGHRARKAKQREANKASNHSLVVGSILVCSWGYEQTNVNFYEVVAVRGGTVDLREIDKDKTATGFMSGTAMPRPGVFVGGLIKGKRARGDNSVRVSGTQRVHLWSGRPQSWSSYA